ncbi:MAG: thermonuclease family protein [Thermomicrobiales bacterium]
MNGVSRRTFVSVAAGGLAAGLLTTHRSLAQSEIPAGAVEANFLRAVDGEKLKVVINGNREEVRLIGVDAPEMVRGDDSTECFANEAKDFLDAQLTGQQVYLVADVEDKDGKDRLWRYVWAYVDGVPVLLNEYLLANGYAVGQTEEKNIAHQAELDAAAKAGQAAKLGLWGSCESAHQEIPRHGGVNEPAALGERVVAGGMAVTLQSAYTTYSYGMSSARGGYKFLVAELYLENVSDGEKDYASNRVKAKDMQTSADFKDIYDPSDSPLGSGKLSPGSYIYGIVGVEIQETTTDVRLEYKINSYGQPYVFWRFAV